MVRSAYDVWNGVDARESPPLTRNKTLVRHKSQGNQNDDFFFLFIHLSSSARV